METEKHDPANPELLALAGRISDGAEPPRGDGAAHGGGDGEPGADDAAGAQLLALSRTVVEAVCRVVTTRWPAAVYSDGEKIIMAGLLVPVFIKHVKSPWFAQWQEELSAAGYALYMGYTGWDRQRAAVAQAKRPEPGASPGPAL